MADDLNQNFVSKAGAILNYACGDSGNWMQSDWNILDLASEADDEIERLRADNNSAHASITLLTGTVEALRRDIERLKSEIVSARETMCNIADEAKVQYRRLLRCLPDADAGLPTAADVRGILKE